MIDTLNLWLDRCNMAAGDPFAILPYLTDIEERQSDGKGYSCKGKLESYNIEASQAGIMITGSLAQYFLPSNLYTLTRSEVQAALEKMSDESHTDIKAAKVWRLDIATIFPVTRPPADYFSCFGNKPYFNRLQATADTLYYSTAQRQLVFYDKNKEAKVKGAIVPPDLAGCNLLRYELRYKENIQRQLQLADPLTAGNLIEQELYLRLVGQWQQEYKTIEKIKTTSAMSETIKKPKDAITIFAAKAMQAAGFTPQHIEDFVADLKQNKEFADPKAYSRLRAELYKMLAIKPDEQNELAKEIETAINNVALYAR